MFEDITNVLEMLVQFIHLMVCIGYFKPGFHLD